MIWLEFLFLQTIIAPQKFLYFNIWTNCHCVYDGYLFQSWVAGLAQSCVHWMQPCWPSTVSLCFLVLLSTFLPRSHITSCSGGPWFLPEGAGVQTWMWGGREKDNSTARLFHAQTRRIVSMWKVYYIYLKVRKTERFSIYCLTPRMAAVVGAGPG